MSAKDQGVTPEKETAPFTGAWIVNLLPLTPQGKVVHP
jgi:hypothetical protein